jgi:signal transduction histidine kinase
MNIKMGNLKQIRLFIILLTAAVALAVTAEHLYFSDLEWKYRTSRLNSELIDREIKSEAMLLEMEAGLEAGENLQFLNHRNVGINSSGNDIILLIYTDNLISYWSDNGVSFPETYDSNFETHDPVFISNGWFIPIHRKYLEHDLVALIAVYRQFPIKNYLLKSGFPDAYKLPEGAVITFDRDQSPFVINGIEGEFHFGLIFPETKPNTIFIIIPIFFWLTVLLLWILLVRELAKILTAGKKLWKGLIAVAIVLILPYIVVLITGMPGSVGSTELFSPLIYSAGTLLPTPGHLLIMSVLLISVISIIFKNSPVKVREENCKPSQLAMPVLLVLLAFSSFIAVEALFRDIISNSAINFEAYKILDISFLSLAGFVTVVILLAVPVILFIRAFRLIHTLPLKKNFAVLLTGFLIMPVAYLTGMGCCLSGLFYIIAVALLILAWIRNPFPQISLVVLFATITAIFTASVIIKYSNLRENENLKVMAVTLASDNDPVAESLLIDLWPVIENDSLLSAMMDRELFSPADINTVYRYLQGEYFTGYWENYDLSMVICRDDSPLRIPSQDSYASNCFVYFDERIKNEGDSITGTGFWFMHNQAGRAYYFSRLLYSYSPFMTNGLFIELVSHIETYQAGYPELLLDETNQRYPRIRDISFAKYADTSLVVRSGDFPYDNIMLPVLFNGQEYLFTTEGGFKHLYYDTDGMTLVITVEEVSFLDMIVTFAYLFITILILSLILLLFITGQKIDILKFDTFRRKLQLAFAAVLTIVFAVMIIGALMLSIAQFKGNHTRILREKITSVYIEMEHKLSAETDLNRDWTQPDYYSLDELLVKFSNVFMTDINLYTPSGTLLATSRPEVFSEKLLGNKIDPTAYSALTVEGKTEFLGEESIGGMKYLSAYMPFYNIDNKLLAYINLPYFRMQNILMGEISNLVVTMINFTLLLLMLMMWLAVFLSERITSPLTLVQRAMASVEYGKKNEHILYRSNDEVGELVKQYNRMIDELGESAGKLARTERELAWREMARQVAHEIKNPLTPMKLNIQQLLKWWRDKAPDFDNRLETFAGNQIEYIDNLSSIATAFSYFARLPGAEPAEVDVVAQLRTSLELFGQSDEATITLDSGNISKAVIMADKEHLNGIFSNLLKNAIQAIPAGAAGEIKITLSASTDKVLITFRDNGVGIPNELKAKMFTPNFTTKSSGMGLGLSIVKRYVETAGGTITYESVPGKGTAFFVELPLLYTVERLDVNDN